MVGGVLGLGLGYLLDSEHEGPAPTPVTVTKTIVLQPEVPSEVEETRSALLEAAESDYEALRPLIPDTGFSYTFGGPVEGGPIAHWQDLERTTGERPLETLSALLQMPWTVSQNGTYVWPRAYSFSNATDLLPDEREQLLAIGDIDKMFIPGTGYLGWRTGIAPDGTWSFFVAGD